MGDVKFEEQVSYKPKVQAGETGLVGLLIKVGIVKDGTSARAILLVVTVICIGAALFLFKSFREANTFQPAPPPAGFTE
ncbi:hypothetical protein K2P56_00055 [Patescibacteria group bacterium]|nr:hypothetical protein [Patescibacteria group bacterium]